MVFRLSALLLLFALTPMEAEAALPLLDNLAGAWNDLDGFASLGQCIAGPPGVGTLLCSPAQLTSVGKGRFEGRGTISATDSVLDVSDKLRRDEISSNDINTLFQDYNYTDALVNVDLNYVGHDFLLGVKPVRYQGQFEVHNPALPYVSLTFRDDRDFHAGTAYELGGDILKLRAGLLAALLVREETMVEGTVVDLASRPPKELLDKQKLTGVFVDLGASLDYRGIVELAVLGKDYGDWLGSRQDHSSRYLFVRRDKDPKIFASLAALPRLWRGKLQVGASVVRFQDETNDFSKQWFATVSYFVGPFRLLTGWRPDLFRSGIALRFSRFEANVAQEWVNRLEDGRKPQPRFTLEVTTGL
jgi:hypothetical protein